MDPYRQGFGHVDSPNSIDLNAVKLCFQVKNIENPFEIFKLLIINIEYLGIPGEPLGTRKVHSDPAPCLFQAHL